MAQYPLVRGEINGYAPLFNEPYYGQPVVNGFDDQPQEPRDMRLQNLSSTSTVQQLSLLGVRYVLDVERKGARRARRGAALTAAAHCRNGDVRTVGGQGAGSPA